MRLFGIVGLLLVVVVGASLASAQSVPQLFQLTQQIGRGHIQSLEWHPTDDIILVSTIRGAWFYDSLLRDVGHIEDARLATYSPDGALVAGMNAENQITLWNSETYASVGTLAGHDTLVTALAWSPAGDFLATGDRTGEVRIWDVSTQHMIRAWQAPTGVKTLRWNPDNTKLAVLMVDEAFLVFTLDYSQAIFSIPPSNCCSDYASFDVVWLDEVTLTRVISGDGGEARQWNIETGELVSEAWPSASLDLWRPSAISPDETLSAKGQANTIQLIDLASGELLHELGGIAFPWQLTWSHDNTRLVGVSSGSEIFLWDVISGTIQASIRQHAGPRPYLEGLMELGEPSIARLPSWNSNSLLLAIPDQLTAVSIWNTDTQQQVALLEGHSVPVVKLAWLPGTDWLAAMAKCDYFDDDYTVHVWDAAAGTLIDEYTHTGCLKGLAWRPQNDELVSVNESPSALYVWDGQTRALVDQLEFDITNYGTALPHPVSLVGMDWSPDGTHIVLHYWDSAHSAKVFNYPDLPLASCIGKCSITNHGHRPTDAHSYWSGDGKQWFTVTWYWDMSRPIEGDPFRIEITVPFNTQSDELITTTLHGHSAPIVEMAPDPSGTNLITISEDNEARLWNVFTGETLLVLSDTSQVAWSPDGTLIGGFNVVDHIWYIYDADNGAALASLPVASQDAGYLVWSPNSQKIAQVVEGVVFIWER